MRNNNYISGIGGGWGGGDALVNRQLRGRRRIDRGKFLLVKWIRILDSGVNVVIGGILGVDK